jgi:hypothetical protein
MRSYQRASSALSRLRIRVITQAQTSTTRPNAATARTPFAIQSPKRQSAISLRELLAEPSLASLADYDASRGVANRAVCPYANVRPASLSRALCGALCNGRQETRRRQLGVRRRAYRVGSLDARSPSRALWSGGAGCPCV